MSCTSQTAGRGPHLLLYPSTSIGCTHLTLLPQEPKRERKPLVEKQAGAGLGVHGVWKTAGSNGSKHGSDEQEGSRKPEAKTEGLRTLIPPHHRDKLHDATGRVLWNSAPSPGGTHKLGLPHPFRS